MITERENVANIFDRHTREHSDFVRYLLDVIVEPENAIYEQLLFDPHSYTQIPTWFPLHSIAKAIELDWNRAHKGKKFTSGRIYADPYLQAMKQLVMSKDMYHYDDAESIVLYFLSNASTYRTPFAKRVKWYLNHLALIESEVMNNELERNI